MSVEKYKWTVDIRCFTYNHSNYITDALNGFVMQKTNFPYIILLVDDASTDGEQDIIRSYVTEQFDLDDHNIAYEKCTDYASITFAQHKTNKNCYIVVHYLNENHYSIQELKPKKMQYLSEWRNACKYEALCEGDDYWIDPLKLQKQVDFMEANPEYVMSHTSVDYLFMDVNRIINYNDVEINTPLNIAGEVLLDDILTRYRIQTLSVMYRRDIYEKVVNSDKFLYNGGYFLMGDTQLWFGFARFGKIHFLPEVTAIYRRVSNSASNQSSLIRRKRFTLSSAEMRYYISLHYDLMEETKNRFKSNYERALIIYWMYDSNFKPKFPVEIENIYIKKIKILGKEIFLNFFRIILGDLRRFKMKI